jgi:hypothetical protein
MRPRAVILNDTATRHHHGCARVMRILAQGLEAAGIEVAHRIPARADWARDRRHLAAIRAAQLVVVNGEGTLHDGAPLGARLLSVLDHEAAAGKPIALVNALWEANPPDWNRWLPRLALAAARDQASAAALREGGASAARWIPDLSLAGEPSRGAAARAGLVVGCSVRAGPRAALGRAAQAWGATYLPTKTLRHPAWRLAPARAALWRAYTGVWRGPVPRFVLAQDEDAYLAALAAAEGHATGRFHGLCLSFVTRTPVLALASRGSKVERLLADAGLGTARLVTPAALAALPAAAARRPWEPWEEAALDAFLAQARAGAARLFADLRGLCS